MEREEWLTSPEASALCGFGLSHLARLCREHRILCDRRGRDWFIQRASLLAYLEEWHPDIFEQITKREQ